MGVTFQLKNVAENTKIDFLINLTGYIIVVAVVSVCCKVIDSLALQLIVV